CAFPLRIRGREQGPDIRRGYGAQQRVGDGVQQNIAIRVPAETPGVIEDYPADLQRNSPLELVRVPAITDAHVVRRTQVFTSCRWPCVVGRWQKPSDTVSSPCGPLCSLWLVFCCFQVKLRKLQVRGRGDLDVFWRAHHHSYFLPGALDQRCLVGSQKAVGVRLIEGLFQ